MPASYKKIAAVDKALDLLMLLSDAGRPMTPKEMAAAMDMPVATVMSYLVTLEARQVIGRVGGDAYDLGIVMARMWSKRVMALKKQIVEAETELVAIGG